MRPFAALAIFALSALAAAPAAAGDPAAGERLFGRCTACHMIESPAGETIQRGGPTGPNLWGVIGRPAASVDGFRYGEGITAAGEAGLVWTEAAVANYLRDPGRFLSEYVGERVRSNMTYRLRRGGEDVAAYLARFGGES